MIIICSIVNSLLFRFITHYHEQPRVLPTAAVLLYTVQDRCLLVGTDTYCYGVRARRDHDSKDVKSVRHV